MGKQSKQAVFNELVSMLESKTDGEAFRLKLKEAVDNGFPVDYKGGEKKRTLLHIAVLNDHALKEGIPCALLDIGAKADVSDSKWNTPLLLLLDRPLNYPDKGVAEGFTKVLGKIISQNMDLREDYSLWNAFFEDYSRQYIFDPCTETNKEVARAVLEFLLFVGAEFEAGMEWFFDEYGDPSSLEPADAKKYEEVAALAEAHGAVEKRFDDEREFDGEFDDECR